MDFSITFPYQVFFPYSAHSVVAYSNHYKQQIQGRALLYRCYIFLRLYYFSLDFWSGLVDSLRGEVDKVFIIKGNI